MSIEVKIEIKGAKELAARLDKLDKKVRNKVVSRALRAGAKVVQSRAKQLAPRQTGALAKAIKVRTSKFFMGRKKKRGEVAIDVTVGKANFQGDTFYGGFQEFGWKAGAQQRQIPGKHFMERAANAVAPQAMAAIIAELAAGIEAAARED